MRRVFFKTLDILYKINEIKKRNLEKKMQNTKEIKDVIMDRRYTKISCGCGSTVARCNLSHHRKTKKHLSWLSERRIRAAKMREELRRDVSIKQFEKSSNDLRDGFFTCNNTFLILFFMSMLGYGIFISI